MKMTDELNNLKFERMKIVLEEQGQQPLFGGSTAGVSLFWKARMGLQARTIIDYVAQLDFCALGYRTT